LAKKPSVLRPEGGCAARGAAAVCAPTNGDALGDQSILMLPGVDLLLTSNCRHIADPVFQEKLKTAGVLLIDPALDPAALPNSALPQSRCARH